MKQCIKKNAYTQIETLIKQNEHFSKEGEEYITKIATQIENELSNSYPNIDSNYQKAVGNILKTLKELEKYKKVCTLVKKGKLTIYKMLKFPYGNKYIQKLNNIENGKKKSDDANIKSVLSSVKELYSSLTGENNKDNKKEEKSENYHNEMEEDNSREYNDDNDNDSLKSIDEKENIRFSPSGNTESKITALNYKGGGDGNNEKNEKMYDPFTIIKDSLLQRKKNIIFPIFYDPSLTRPSRTQNSNDVVALRGNRLQIYKGPLTINKSQLDKCSFYSTNSIELFRQFPSFGDEIVITNRAKTSEVVPYCEKQLNNKAKIELFGWIEVDSDRAEKLTNLIEECDRHDKCGCYISQGIKMYIFTLSKKYSKFYKIVKNETDFNNTALYRGKEKMLVFVLLGNKSEIENLTGRKIEPVVIKRKEITIEEEQEKENDSENENMSPLTDEENNKNLNISTMNENDIKLEKLLQTNDMNLLVDYVNKNFSNLSQEEIVNKLMTFNEESRTKLLDLIMQYQQASQEDDNTNNNLKDEVMEDNTSNANNNVQARIEEVINEEQLKRINQINRPPTMFYPPQIMYPQMNMPTVPQNMLADYYRTMQQQNPNQNPNQNPILNQNSIINPNPILNQNPNLNPNLIPNPNFNQNQISQNPNLNPILSQNTNQNSSV